MRSTLYLRGLRQADHTVFAVADGQKTYRDPLTGREQAYSSGQQVKRSILDTMAAELGEKRAPVTFVRVKEGNALKSREPWSECDPTYPDQLVGGWMRAAARTGDAEGGGVIKRRSPLSISAMRPLHPLLARVDEEKVITFDRRDDAANNPVKVVDKDGKELSLEDLSEFLESNNRTLTRMQFVGGQKRAYGLYVYDVAIDLSRLFSVTTDLADPELSKDVLEKLRADGWVEKNGRLVAPQEMRERLIPALAHALVHWSITSNQARTYSPQHTLALAVSDRASLLGSAIRADLDEESEWDKALPVIERSQDVDVFVTPTARGVIAGIAADSNALQAAQDEIEKRLRAYDYEA
ncbi:MAG: CRISPR-associated protein Cas7 [Rhodothermales bacterium]|nr:CRISPR-associated protein Cas7 [Rhodothermales bacterium]